LWAGISSLGSFFTNLGRAIWDGFKSVIPSWMTNWLSGGGSVRADQPTVTSGQVNFNPNVTPQDTTTAGNPYSGTISTDPFSGLTRALGGIIPQYAQTGFLMRPRGTDTVPAMLSPGEFIMSRGAVDRLGLPMMEALNRGVSPGQQQTNGGSVNLSVNINTTKPVDDDFVRNKMIPEIMRQLRRDSLDGRRVLSPIGVRS